MDELQGRVAIVTGSARGIGRAIALGLARAGARVVVTDRLAGAAAARTEDGSVEATAAEIEAAGGQALALRCDVSSPAEVETMVQAVLARWGRIDVLVNNAGILSRKTLLETTPSEWQAVIGTNLNGAYFCCRAVAPAMIAQKGGSIINVMTGAAEGAEAALATYRLSKAALNQLTLKLSAELRDHGIAVNGLAPGLTRTPGGIRESSRVGIDLAGVPLAEETRVADLAVYLAVRAPDPARLITGSFFRESEYGVTWP
jgi:3-oxoacyl-[acyl-carrier protein] reductase